MKKKTWQRGVAALLIAMLAFPAMASDTVSYQGVLRDNAGDPIADGVYPFDFTIYDAATGGSALWTESQGSVATVGGTFSVQLGSATPFGTVFGDNVGTTLYLEVAADTGSGSQVYGPRIPLSGVPYAAYAASAGSVAGLNTGDLEESAEIDSDIAAHDGSGTAHSDIRGDIATVEGNFNAHASDQNAHRTPAEIFAAVLSQDGSGTGLDADRVDGVQASALEESAEIDADIMAHDMDIAAHANIELDASNITSGTFDNARLNMGAGNGLNADQVDGFEAADLDDSAEIDADIDAHNTDASAHANLAIDGAQITSGLISNARLNMGAGNGLNADQVDGFEAAELTAPAGVVSSYAGATAPTGWLLCDGSAVDRTTYADLFAVIGETYGAGDGSTTFNLPNLQGRVVAGLDGADTAFDVLGETGGAKTHTLTESEMPSHTHIQNPHTHTQNAHGHTQSGHAHAFTTGTGNAAFHRLVYAGGNGRANNHQTGWSGSNGFGDFTDTNYNMSAHTHSGSTDTRTPAIQNATATNQNTTAVNQATGGGQPHNNLQPYITLNYIIKH